MAQHRRTRRSFLRTLILSGVGTVALWKYLTPARSAMAREVAVRVDDVPFGGALVLPEEGFAVIRSPAGRVDALSLTCTHLGCRVTATEDGFACPCHGSCFDREGHVTRGPAARALRRLPHSLQDGVLRVEPEEA